MKYRRRIYYSASQRAEIWDRWQRGESMSSIVGVNIAEPELDIAANLKSVSLPAFILRLCENSDT